MATSRNRSHFWVIALGWAGIVPFYLAAMLVVSDADIAGRVLTGYGVGITAFLAGTLWGSARTSSGDAKSWRLCFSNMVVLWVVAALVFAPPAGSATAQLFAFWALLGFEFRQSNTVGWYLKYRLQLTLAVSPAYVAFIAMTVSL